MVKIGLAFSDVTLMNAVTAMLDGSEYELSHDVENTEFIITDKFFETVGKRRVLYVGREYRGEKPYLRIPFDRTMLENALKQLVSDNKTKLLSINKRSGTVIFCGERIKLTEKELALLTLLYENCGKTVSDSEIVKRIWHNETVFDSNIAAVYIKYLRSKLDEKAGRRFIYRVRGTGYVLKLDREE